jgi:hypothetical protein
MPSHQWVRNFQIEQSDIDHITGVLLEKEQPLSTEQIARIIVDERLSREVHVLQERYKDARFYNPADTYQVGDHLIFPLLNYQSGIVKNRRAGVNPEFEPFTVIAVEFESQDGTSGPVREFASELTVPHALSRPHTGEYESQAFISTLSADEILAEAGDDIIYAVESRLSETDSLVQVAGKWFPRDLLTEVNVGHLHLAEAILDINGGGPLSTSAILNEMGGLDGGSKLLQEFSLNYALKEDSRFDEVGPKGVVLWYLNRLEPAEVQQTPRILKYTPIDYDRSVLTPDLLEIEREIGDEYSLSSDSGATGTAREATITLIYPHRRMGTLPLNETSRMVFPSGQRTLRTYITLIDGQDQEEYPGWVVRKGRYVFGLNRFYRKHALPVGAHISVTQDEADPTSRIIVNFNAYRPRTEWVRLLVPQNNQIVFEEARRAIGADYDDLMLMGADNPEAVDALFETYEQQRKPLVSIIHNVISALAHLTPQGTIHVKTIYSVVNAVRRCPPGPILAALITGLDFQNVGGHYWKLKER